ncbi:MAG: S53 family peptidase [Chloroflexi bacterium]|nr:S53 family peptidase [Chloroflexota bacterium]
MKEKILALLVILSVVLMSPSAALAAPASPTSVFLPAVTTVSTGAAMTAQSSGNTTLHGSAPAWANSKNLTGPADPQSAIGFRVYLGWQNAAAAEAFAQSVSDPNSPMYGKYLTSAQFRQKFAPSQAEVNAVQSWLRSQGFDVVYTPQNNHYVSAQGTVAQAETAFGAKFDLYKVNGKSVRSPSQDVSIPSSLATVVTGVIGLDDSAVFTQPDIIRDAPPTAGFRNAPPLPDYWGGTNSSYAYPSGFTDVTSPTTAPWAVKGYTPAQIKGAYGIPSTYDGAGQTVAVIDAYASPTILSDVNQWSINRGLPEMSPSQLVQVVPPGIYRRPNNRAQSPSGWYGEETLDIEAVHGMAPAAKIVFVGAPNNYRDLDAAMNYVVDRQVAQIVTNSYGFPTELLPRGYVKPFEDTLIQAAAEGIGVYFSSGDNGDETSRFGFATADWPASSPWVTSVGGTSLAIGAENNRVFETGWGTSNYNCNTTTLACTRTGWLYGAGGGVSQLFAEPSYQKNAGLDLTGRGVPDVAALADPQMGFLVGQTQTFPDGVYYDEYRIGGTSLASPIFAGLMALLDQKAGKPHGFANPLFYENASAFYDVLPMNTAVARRNFNNGVDATNGTSDFLRTFNDYSGSPTQFTGTGWDNVTGLGTPSSAFMNLP